MSKPTRPQPLPVTLQRAASRPATQQAKKTPTAPPAYRPQPAPKVLQRKPATNQQAAAKQPPPPTKSGRPPSAPPVYRPQPVPKVLQAKPAFTQPPPKGPGRTPPQAPPVYRPQPLPKVLQRKRAGGRQPDTGQPPGRPLATGGQPPNPRPDSGFSPSAKLPNSRPRAATTAAQLKAATAGSRPGVTGSNRPRPAHSPSSGPAQARASNNGAPPARGTRFQTGTRAVVQRMIERLWNSQRRGIYEEAFSVFDKACREVDPDYQTFADDANSVISFKEHRLGEPHPSGLETGHAAGLTEYVISGENNSDVYILGKDPEKSQSWKRYKEPFTSRRVKLEISMRLEEREISPAEALQTLIHEWALHGHPFASIINEARKEASFKDSKHLIKDQVRELDADKHHRHLAEDWGPQMLMQKITTAAKKHLTGSMSSEELDLHTLADINARRGEAKLDPLKTIPDGSKGEPANDELFDDTELEAFLNSD